MAPPCATVDICRLPVRVEERNWNVTFFIATAPGFDRLSLPGEDWLLWRSRLKGFLFFFFFWNSQFSKWCVDTFTFGTQRVGQWLDSFLWVFFLSFLQVVLCLSSGNASSRTNFDACSVDRSNISSKVFFSPQNLFFLCFLFAFVSLPLVRDIYHRKSVNFVDVFSGLFEMSGFVQEAFSIDQRRTKINRCTLIETRVINEELNSKLNKWQCNHWGKCWSIILT